AMITSLSTCCAASAPRCASSRRRSIRKAAPTASTITITAIRTAMCTTSDTAAPMTTDRTLDSAGLFRLLAWLSPSYPIGAFSYSHGLEYAIEAGLVRDRASLGDWIAGVLRHGSGRIDGALL